MSLDRRIFMITVSTGLSGFAVGAWAQTPALVDEKSPQAVALGYVADASRVDAKKFPKYAAGQLCSNCALYQGKPSDAAAPCSLFAGKPVAGKGWCNAWVRKA